MHEVRIENRVSHTTTNWKEATHWYKSFCEDQKNKKVVLYKDGTLYATHKKFALKEPKNV